MRSNAEQAQVLATKAEHDIQLAQLGLDNNAALDGVCFHLQQAAEKLLKALLSFLSLDYPLTHNIQVLLDLALAHCPELAPLRPELTALSPYAVEMRYDDIYPEREEALTAWQAVGRLRQVVHSRLSFHLPL
ncbi:MAG: HEPN domain-containing protein [Acidobacteria bacterium]|nr:HEPN domain-containing protein [Acidobacteriota bacterium]